MTIMSSDGLLCVDIGNYNIWNCLYSTVITKLQYIKADIQSAVSFLESGNCSAEKCIETAKQLNLIRDHLSKYSPSELVFDYKNPSTKAPWDGNISPIVTSCGNFFTTADGKDLIFELNSVLCYCSIKKIAVICQ